MVHSAMQDDPSSRSILNKSYILSGRPRARGSSSIQLNKGNAGWRRYLQTPFQREELPPPNTTRSIWYESSVGRDTVFNNLYNVVKLITQPTNQYVRIYLFKHRHFHRRYLRRCVLSRYWKQEKETGIAGR